jgi:hypothetical protein
MQTGAVMFLQFGDSPKQVMNQAAVSRQHQFHVQGVDLLQAGQVLPERVFHIHPVRDIGSNIKENMIAGYEDFLFGLIKADMPR